MPVSARPKQQPQVPEEREPCRIQDIFSGLAIALDRIYTNQGFTGTNRTRAESAWTGCSCSTPQPFTSRRLRRGSVRLSCWRQGGGLPQ